MASSNKHLAFPGQSAYNQHSGVISHVSEKRKIRFRSTVWFSSRSQWPRGLRRGSGAACLLGLRVRLPTGEWKSISCECCQVQPLRRTDLSSRGVLPNEVCLRVIVKPRQWGYHGTPRAVMAWNDSWGTDTYQQQIRLTKVGGRSVIQRCLRRLKWSGKRLSADW
jgi:hypothetical protein